MVGYGLGFVLIIVGIISLMLSFHLKLHSINEDSIISKTWFGFSKTKTLVSLIMGVVLSIDAFFDTDVMFLKYLRINSVMILLYIIIPRYGMIEPNRNMKLYFSIYHHHPHCKCLYSNYSHSIIKTNQNYAQLPIKWTIHSSVYFL